MFPGYNAPIDAMPDYTYTVRSDNSFVVFFCGEEIYVSRRYRLFVQADEGAKDFIKRAIKTPPAEITLDVQSVSAGAKSKNRS